MASHIYNKHALAQLSCLACEQHMNNYCIYLGKFCISLCTVSNVNKRHIEKIDIQSRRPWINEKVLYLPSVHQSTPSLSFPSFILQYMVFAIKIKVKVSFFWFVMHQHNQRFIKIWSVEFMFFNLNCFHTFTLNVRGK